MRSDINGWDYNEHQRAVPPRRVRPPRNDWRKTFVTYADDPRVTPACSGDASATYLLAGTPEEQQRGIELFCYRCPIRRACSEIRADEPDLFAGGQAFGGFTSRAYGDHWNPNAS